MADQQKITPFLFEGEWLVRTIEREGAPWFAHPDACRVLEIENTRAAAARLDDDEKGVVTIDTLGGPQQVTFISESGLYSLILTSRKPAAKKVKRWVTSEVLPSIRRTGFYSTLGGQPQSPEVLVDRPWEERPTEERNTVLRTAAAIGRYGNHPLAFWYLVNVAKVADFPHLLLPSWWQPELALQPNGSGAVTIIVPQNGGQH